MIERQVLLGGELISLEFNCVRKENYIFACSILNLIYFILIWVCNEIELLYCLIISINQ